MKWHLQLTMLNCFLTAAVRRLINRTLFFRANSDAFSFCASKASPKKNQDHGLSKFGLVGRQFIQAKQSLEFIQSEANPYLREAELLQGMTKTEDQASVTIRSEAVKWTNKASLLKELDVAFGRGGIQSFALEGVLGELQVRP